MCLCQFEKCIEINKIKTKNTVSYSLKYYIELESLPSRLECIDDTNLTHRITGKEIQKKKDYAPSEKSFGTTALGK